MKYLVILADIHPRHDLDVIYRRIGEYLDNCDPDDRVEITIKRK